MQDGYHNDKLIPTQYYYGDLYFYFLKVGLALFGIFFSAAGILACIVGTYATFTSGPLNIDMVALQGIVFLFTFNTLSIGVLFTHMYPQIGISPEALWYRHFFVGWNSIRWQDVEEIRPAKTLFITQGTVVYSQQFPWYYRFFGRSYGRRRGKALFIPNQLVTNREFSSLLQRNRIPVKISI